MEFLVEFEIEVPGRLVNTDFASHEADVAFAAETLADQGRLLRLWTLPSGREEDKILGLYRVENVEELDDILDHLPLHECVNVVITRLDPQPNDPHCVRDGHAST